MAPTVLVGKVVGFCLLTFDAQGQGGGSGDVPSQYPLLSSLRAVYPFPVFNAGQTPACVSIKLQFYLVLWFGGLQLQAQPFVVLSFAACSGGLGSGKPAGALLIPPFRCPQPLLGLATRYRFLPCARDTTASSIGYRGESSSCRRYGFDIFELWDGQSLQR